MDNFKEAFEDLVKDMYDAEVRVSKALPDAADAAQNMELKQGFPNEGTHHTFTAGCSNVRL